MPIQQKCCCEDCPPNTRRCCVPEAPCEGNCVCDLPEEDCLELEGIYYPENSAEYCNEPPCAPKTGCCYDSPECPGMKICEPKTFQECQALGGIFNIECSDDCPGCNVGEVVVKYHHTALGIYDRLWRGQTYNGYCNTPNTKTLTRNCVHQQFGYNSSPESKLNLWTTDLPNLNLMQQYKLAGGDPPGVSIPPYVFTLFDGTTRTLNLGAGDTVLHIKRACSRLYAWASFNLAIVPYRTNVPSDTPELGICTCDDCNCGTIAGCATPCGTYPNCTGFCAARSRRAILASEKMEYNYPWVYPSPTVDHELAAARSKLFVGRLNIRLSGNITPTDLEMKSWNSTQFISAIATSSNPEGNITISADIPYSKYYISGSPDYYWMSHNPKVKYRSDILEFPLARTPTYTLDYSYEYDPDPNDPESPCDQGSFYLIHLRSAGTLGGFQL